MSKILSLKGIHKSFPTGNNQLSVLSDINLDIATGQFISIIGESGSGKSTLLNSIAGLDSINSGEITLMGEKINGLSERKLALLRSKHLGFIFQSHNLLNDFTALENLLLPQQLLTNDKKYIINRAENILKSIGLYERRHHKPGELSGGEMQRVAVARAMINEPALILSDEPTGNLDQKNSKIVFDLLLQLCRERQTSILMVTHSTRLSHNCDIIYELKDQTLHQTK